jgi:hypothetical protein
VTEERYIFNASRLITLWLLPIFFTFLILFLIYLKFDSTNELTLTDIIAWTLFSTFAVGFFVFLFFNHLPFAKQTELIVVDKNFKIIQGDNSYLTNYGEIKEIVEYSSNKLPWSLIMKWKIKLSEREIIISSLTISKFNFERHFYGKIKHETSLLPTI